MITSIDSISSLLTFGQHISDSLNWWKVTHFNVNSVTFAKYCKNHWNSSVYCLAETTLRFEKILKYSSSGFLRVFEDGSSDILETLKLSRDSPIRLKISSICWMLRLFRSKLLIFLYWKLHSGIANYVVINFIFYYQEPFAVP